MSRSPISAKRTISPVSLKEGATANDRRIITAALIANGPPSATTDGWPTFNASHLHTVVDVLDAGGSIDWSLWLYSRFHEKWCLDTRLGTAGVVSLAGADTDNPQLKIVEIAGVDRVYIELANLVGMVNGVDVHIGANTYL